MNDKIYALNQGFISERIKYLMNGQNRLKTKYFTISAMVKDMYESSCKIFNYDSVNPDDRKLEREQKQRIISRHLKGTLPSYDWLIAYCNFFGCDSDFLLGIQEKPSKDITDISAKTGLSDNAIKSILKLQSADNEKTDSDYRIMQILNDLLVVDNGNLFKELMQSIRTYLCASEYTTPAVFDKDGQIIKSSTEKRYKNIFGKRLNILVLLNRYGKGIPIMITKSLIESSALRSIGQCLDIINVRKKSDLKSKKGNSL